MMRRPCEKDISLHSKNFFYFNINCDEVMIFIFMFLFKFIFIFIFVCIFVSISILNFMLNLIFIFIIILTFTWIINPIGITFSPWTGWSTGYKCCWTLENKWKRCHGESKRMDFEICKLISSIQFKSSDDENYYTIIYMKSEEKEKVNFDKDII